MLTVNAYAATSPTEPLVPTTITRRDVGPKDVLIEIAYAGVCHSDIHTVRGDWGPITYPQVVGHEVAGTVVEVGPDVTKHAVGDRVGVGTIVNSCRECDNCRAGEEQYCLQGNTQAYCSVDRDGTITQGGYSTHVVVDEDFVLRIPDSLDFSKVAPLLCAGITTYSPLRHWQTGPGTSGGRGRHGRSRPPRRQARPRHGCGGDRAVPDPVETRRRSPLRRRRLLRDQRPRHLRPAREQLRPDHQHRLSPGRPQRPPAAAAPQRHPGQCRRTLRAAPDRRVLPLR